MDEIKEKALLALANNMSASKLKISTYDFDSEYQLGQDGGLVLVSCKANIRTYGKVLKIPIGENEQYKTFEEAKEATERKWSEYYRKVRQNRSPAEIQAEHRRQKRYRDSRKRTRVQLERQQ